MTTKDKYLKFTLDNVSLQPMEFFAKTMVFFCDELDEIKKDIEKLKGDNR